MLIILKAVQRNSWTYMLWTRSVLIWFISSNLCNCTNGPRLRLPLKKCHYNVLSEFIMREKKQPPNLTETGFNACIGDIVLWMNVRSSYSVVKHNSEDFSAGMMSLQDLLCTIKLHRLNLTLPLKDVSPPIHVLIWIIAASQVTCNLHHYYLSPR